MNKKFFVSLAIILFAVFSFTVCFATDDAGKALGNAANGVRNFVGGVEDTVENAAKDVSNTSKNVTGTAENTMNNGTTHDGYTTDGRTTTNNNGKYTTSRVATGTTFMGMTTNTWTWLIVGIAAIAIIAVVWYYSMQFTNTKKNNHNDRLD